ncbi:MAG: 3-oxoacyl-ACP reductase [Proteobacteria bacterium]|nr:3-oxoacyl-ACP reductase [Pseudomonadota bacterium]
MIVVTGATRGLGKSICQRLIDKGERVVGLSRSIENLPFEVLKCDVSNYSSVKQAARDVKKMKEKVDAIINVAGIASMNMAVTTDENTVRKLINTNLLGVIFCCQLFAPILLRQKHGCFINFSTIAVPLALKGESVYAASKAGVETFSRTFAREMADFNVRVNCIAPGPIQTDLLRGISEAQINTIISNQIIQKQFQKTDVCDLIELLIDTRSSSLTGQIFNIGGV